MNWQLVVRPKPTKYDFFKSILFCNFLIAGAGTIYSKKYYKNRNEYNPYFLLALCYTGLYLNCIYLLHIDWGRILYERNFNR